MSARGYTVDQTSVGRPIAGVATGRTHTITVERRLVPIVFVPGIMGSRLKFTPAAGGPQKVWDPDDLKFTWDQWISLTRSRARAKKQLIIGSRRHDDKRLVPFTDDPEHNRHLSLTPIEVARGWGGVLWRSYGDFLRWLVNDLRTRQQVLGELFNDSAALTVTPVYAFPYDWTSSCKLGGMALKARIPAIIAQAQQELKDYAARAGRPAPTDLPCPGVILVTHSMGGLVARSACKAGANVLGVIHGVQPAAGAAAAYWRMKSGFPRPPHLVTDLKGLGGALALGKDGREVTALLGNMPGGLQLLPTREYRVPGGGAAWLFWPEADGKVTALPGPGDDVYEAVYKTQDKPWRLIPDPAWLEPATDGRPADTPAGAPAAPPGTPDRFGQRAGVRTPAAADQPAAGTADPTPWDAYLAAVEHAAEFHSDLAGYQHPRSIHFWGVGGTSTPAMVRFATRQEMAPPVNYWTAPQADELCARLSATEENAGTYVFWQPVVRNGPASDPALPGTPVWRCEVLPADAAGDGTVPVLSGRALAARQGTAGAFGAIEHEQAYNVDKVRRFVTLALADLLTPASGAR